MPNLMTLNEFQIKSLITKNYMSEFNLIDDYNITFKENGNKATIEVFFKEVEYMNGFILLLMIMWLTISKIGYILE